MNLSQCYRGTKGSPECEQEDGSIGNLADTCLTEESASHHMDGKPTKSCIYIYIYIYICISFLGIGLLSSLAVLYLLVHV